MRGRPGPTWSIFINAPPERVYPYLADVGRHGEWGSEADAMVISAETPGEPSVGKTYKAEGTLLGKRNPSTVKITALDPPKTIEIEAEDSSGKSGHVFTLTPQDGGTSSSGRSMGSSSRCSDPSSSGSSRARST